VPVREVHLALGQQPDMAHSIWVTVSVWSKRLLLSRTLTRLLVCASGALATSASLASQAFLENLVSRKRGV
jgi:hypothetical protein